MSVLPKGSRWIIDINLFSGISDGTEKQFGEWQLMVHSNYVSKNFSTTAEGISMLHVSKPTDSIHFILKPASADLMKTFHISS